MPRQSIGERPMTDAERRARYRAARTVGKPVIRQTYETAPSLNRCRPCAIPILASFRRSNRRVVSAGIEQRDGPRLE